MRHQHGRNPVRIVHLVVELGSVHRNAEGKARTDLLERINREPRSRPFHVVSPAFRNELRPSIAAAAIRPERMQPPRNVPSRARSPCMPPPPKPAASPTA